MTRTVAAGLLPPTTEFHGLVYGCSSCRMRELLLSMLFLHRNQAEVVRADSNAKDVARLWMTSK